jgi:hypothetical protein
VIVTAGPAGDDGAEAAAVPPDAVPAAAADPLALDLSVIVVLLPVQAVSATTSVPAARAETTPIALMSTL